MLFCVVTFHMQWFVLFFTGDLESVGDVSPVYLIFLVRSWTLWFRLQSAQEELPETVYDGTQSVLQYSSGCALPVPVLSTCSG